MPRPQITIKLSIEEQDALTAIAEKLHCLTDEGRPSLRPLMRNIANGFLVVSRPASNRKKEP